TVDYLAPEQVIDSHNVDARADVYSLGCTLYHLLTGRTPFGEAHPTARPGMHAGPTEPPAVEKLCPEAAGAVAEAVRKMMAKKRERRYQTPGEAARALAALARRRVAASRGGAGGWPSTEAPGPGRRLPPPVPSGTTRPPEGRETTARSAGPHRPP